MQEDPLQAAWERGARAFARRTRAKQRRRRRLRIAAAFATALLLGGAAWVFVLRGNDEPSQAASVVKHTKSLDPPAPPVEASTCRTPLDPEDPLRIWIGGDSLAGSLGPALGELAADTGVAQPTYDYHTSSGLSTPGFFNWAERGIEEMARVNPEIVVFIIGANDAGTVRSTVLTENGEVAWSASYAQHVNEMLDYFSANGRTVYWVGSPTLRDQNVEVAEINAVAREIVEQREGATYVDAFTLFADANGEFTATLPGTDDKDVRVRTPDGVHFTTAGAELLSDYVFAYLDQQCALEDQAVPGEKQPVRQSPGSGVLPKSFGTVPGNPSTTGSTAPATAPPTSSSTSTSTSTSMSTSSTSQTTPTTTP